MIDILVESEFIGQTVAIRDKFVNQALSTKQNLRIRHKNNTMTILHKDIKDAIKGKSKKPVPDYYGDKPNYLIYFRWKPNQVSHQKALL